MNWTRDESIRLSQLCILFFALALAGLDIGFWWFARWFAWLRGLSAQAGLGIVIAFYLCSVFGWICLYRLWRLLGGLRRGQVFVPENVTHLRGVSWCCAAVALICLGAALCYLPFLFVAAAAAFMALIVRIVKNVFQQAIAMKDELDLTI